MVVMVVAVATAAENRSWFGSAVTCQDREHPVTNRPPGKNNGGTVLKDRQRQSKQTNKK